MLPTARLTGISSPIATQNRSAGWPASPRVAATITRADEADDDADDAQQVRPSDAEQDREHQRDDRRQREHDAGVAGTQMRNRRKHQEIRDGVGDRRDDEEIAQLAPVRPNALPLRSSAHEQHAAGAAAR